MTAAEADSRAAELVIAVMVREHWSDEPTEVAAALNRIFVWLRRRLTHGDKILRRQMEKPLGRQVKPSRKQEKVLEGLAAQAKPPRSRQE